MTVRMLFAFSSLRSIEFDVVVGVSLRDFDRKINTIVKLNCDWKASYSAMMLLAPHLCFDYLWLMSVVPSQ